MAQSLILIALIATWLWWKKRRTASAIWNMQRMSDVDLSEHARKSAREEFNENIQKYDIVDMHLMLNAHISGFYAGARFIEKYGPNHDGRILIERLLFPTLRPAVWEYGIDYSGRYIMGFPSLSQNTGIMLKTHASSGFRKGYQFRINHKVTHVEPNSAAIPARFGSTPA